MQLLILLALLVIIVLLAPWMLGVIATVFVAGGAAFVVFGVVTALVLGVATLLLRHVYDPVKQQKRHEKRVKRLTDAANRANKRPH
jgi:Na+/pantothenate symporter